MSPMNRRCSFLLLFAALSACSGESDVSPSNAPSAQRSPDGRPTASIATPSAPALPSLLLITMDTTRADRIGAYGYAKAETPNLDRLAKNGVRFARAYSAVPYTLPSHTSLFTGVYPPEHGIRVNATTGLPADLPTMTDAFASRGYRTGAFVSAAVLDSSYGLSRAFDVYDDDLGPGATQAVIAQSRIGARVAESAIAWLESAPDRPFFCWAHFFDPHAGYEPPAPYKDRLEHPYDGEIAYMDAQIGRLLSWLDARDLLSTTLVIAAADHGEGLGEHGEKTHGVLLYDSTMHVPLIMSQPAKFSGSRVANDVVSLIDVFPTVCEIMGFEVPRGVRGRSLVRAMRGESLEPRSIYGESEYCKLNFGWSGMYSLSSATWKYIDSPGPELYERERDPREEKNLAGEEGARATAMSTELTKLRDSLSAQALTTTPVDPEVLARAAALGYVGDADTDAEADPDAARINPRDKLELVEKFHNAIGLGQRGRFADMIEPLQEVVAEYPNGLGFRTELSTALMQVGRLEEAKAQANAAIELDPKYHPAHVALGNALQKEERYAEALEEFTKVLELKPEILLTHTNFVTCLVKLGRVDEALVHARLLVEKKPLKPDYRIGLASLLRQGGRMDELKTVLEDGLAQQDAGLRVFAAWEFATSPSESVRDGARAVGLCEELLDAGVPRGADLLDTLAAAYAEAGRFDDAVKTADEAIALAQAGQRADLSEAIAGRATLYRSKQPFRAK
jgi:arylsulfatase A-like enzyme